MEDGIELADPKEKLVLIVDDDDGALQLLKHVVGKEGFRIDAAVDGEEALEKIESLAPDLVVLDLMLPRYGGFEVLRRLQGGERRRTPVIVVTGRYTDRSTSELIRQESNVVDFLEKPVKLPALVGMMHRVLKTRPPELKAEPRPQG